MRNTSQNNKLQIVNVEEKDDVKVLYLDVNEINNKNIADFMTLPGGVSFVLAFISIDSDIDKAGKLLQEALPSDAKFMMVSAIGELYSIVGGRTTYPPMKEHRQKILLQAFSKRMVKKCEIISIPLHNEDLLEEREDISIDERIDLIKNEFDKAHSKINFPINSQDTVALTYIDGVSKCESFVVQAIYESKNYHNVVFVGRDKEQNPRYAAMRGTDENRYRGEARGSEKAYGFGHIGTDEKLFVFESPIDLLSYITAVPEEWEKHSYISLGGLSEKAMKRMYTEYPHIHSIYLCLDNDEPGNERCRQFVSLIPEELSVYRLEPVKKDWNECLVAEVPVS